MVGSEQRLQGTSGSAITFTARTPNSGDLLAVVCAAVTGPNSILAVTSTTGTNSPFTLAESCANTGGADDEIWYFPGSAAVSTTVKVTPTTTSTYQCALTEWSGVVQSNPIDVLGNCGKSGSGTAINTGPITTTLAGDLILGPLVTTGSNNLNSSLSCGPTTCSGLPTAWNLHLQSVELQHSDAADGLHHLNCTRPIRRAGVRNSKPWLGRRRGCLPTSSGRRADANRNCNHNSDRRTDGHCHGNRNCDGHADAQCHGNGNCNSNCYVDPDGNRNSNGHVDPDGKRNRNADGNCNSDCDADPDADGDGDSDRYVDADGDGNCNFDRYADEYSDGDSNRYSN